MQARYTQTSRSQATRPMSGPARAQDPSLCYAPRLAPVPLPNVSRVVYYDSTGAPIPTPHSADAARYDYPPSLPHQPQAPALSFVTPAPKKPVDPPRASPPRRATTYPPGHASMYARVTPPPRTSAQNAHYVLVSAPQQRDVYYGLPQSTPAPRLIAVPASHYYHGRAPMDPQQGVPPTT